MQNLQKTSVVLIKYIVVQSNTTDVKKIIGYTACTKNFVSAFLLRRSVCGIISATKQLDDEFYSRDDPFSNKAIGKWTCDKIMHCHLE